MARLAITVLMILDAPVCSSPKSRCDVVRSGQQGDALFKEEEKRALVLRAVDEAITKTQDYTHKVAALMPRGVVIRIERNSVHPDLPCPVEGGCFPLDSNLQM